VPPTAGDPWASARPLLINGFDQETAAVIMARIAVFKDETTSGFHSLQWLDRALIKFCGHFGDYTKGDETSFSLASNLSLYPQFMFHLRRCPIIRHFNNSPDESVYNRFMIHRETVNNSLCMIQPTLDCYSFASPEPYPVLLSATSVAPDRILLLDTFFHVCIWSGSTIAEWRSKGYQNIPEYQSFKKLLEMPGQDALSLLQSRFPRPRFIECDQGSSQSRFLLAVIDPAITHNSMGAGASGEVVFTEDVSLDVFMQHLKKLSVANPK
jgi:protein transport protein SEC23